MQDVAEEIRSRGVRGMGIALDVLDFESVPRAQDRIVQETGGIDIWVNNAGGNLDRKMYGLPDISLEKWQEQINLNLTSKFWGAQQAAKRMRDGGGIISIISVAAHSASPGFGAYSAANNAVISMTRTMAVELAPRRITVNCIAPGVRRFSTGVLEAAAPHVGQYRVPRKIGPRHDGHAMVASWARQ